MGVILSARVNAAGKEVQRKVRVDFFNNREQAVLSKNHKQRRAGCSSTVTRSVFGSLNHLQE